jgi:hypothetical protein
MKTAIGVVAIFITLPIWFYLLFQILVRVQATELMFFLYWIYVPFSLLIAIINKLIED